MKLREVKWLAKCHTATWCGGTRIQVSWLDSTPLPYSTFFKAASNPFGVHFSHFPLSTDPIWPALRDFSKCLTLYVSRVAVRRRKKKARVVSKTFSFLLHPLIQMTHPAPNDPAALGSQPAQPTEPAAVPGAEMPLSQDGRQRTRVSLKYICRPQSLLSHSLLDLSFISLYLIPPPFSSFPPSPCPLPYQIVGLESGRWLSSHQSHLCVMLIKLCNLYEPLCPPFKNRVVIPTEGGDLLDSWLRNTRARAWHVVGAH